MLFLIASCYVVAQECSSYSTSFGPFNYANTGSAQHSTGVHAWNETYFGTCTYSGPKGPCGVTATASSGDVGAGDSGTLFLADCCYHVPGTATAQGIASSNGGSAVAGTEAAVSFDDCLLSSCAVKISISGSSSGVGLSATFDPTSIFNDKVSYTAGCVAEVSTSGGGGGGCGGSPIVIDTTGKGFHFTDPAKACINFNLKDNGRPVCLSWPVVGSGNAWLALPDADGNVNSSKQLFGNFTPHPNHESENPNGFLALAEYDINKDLVIDNKDPLWAKLRLWIDRHCYLDRAATCTSQPSELHTLEEFGITSIDLVYGQDKKADQWGNWFRYYAPMNIDMTMDDRQHSTDKLGRTAYDVFLVSAGNVNSLSDIACQ